MVNASKAMLSLADPGREPSLVENQPDLALSSSSASSSSSSFTVAAAHTRDAPPAARSTKHELKRSAEKKFRQRYVLLQQAYEQRLQALTAQVRHVIAELQSDATIEYLQQDPLTHEYASARVAEILSECFTGEREKYIQMVSDQLAWQASDLREAERRLRASKKRERVLQQKFVHSQSTIRELQHRLEQSQHTCSDRQRQIERLEVHVREREQQRDAVREELETMRPVTTSLTTLQLEYEAFQVRVQNEREQERSAHDKLQLQLQQLREERTQSEGERRALERDVQHMRQLVVLTEAKNDELSQSLRQVQAEEYATRLRKLEHELVQQRHVNELLQKDNEQLTKKYEEFGAQVEAYMDEQAQVRATSVSQATEREKKLQDELVSIKAQTAEALKTKHSELVRLADQVKFRQDALSKAELKVTVLTERVAALEASLAEEKLRNAKQASELEKEIAQWRGAVEKEKDRVKAIELQLAQTTQSYESRLAAVHEAAAQQQQQSVKEMELESRTRWQNEFAAQQEARIEALKRKYDSAIETQQNELLQARRLAVDAAKSATEKVEQVKSMQQQQQQQQGDAEAEARRRQDAVDAERLRRLEAERAKELKQQQKMLDERDRRVKELEKQIAEMAEAMKKAMREKQKTSDKPEAPSVVVVNVGSTDDLADSPHADAVGAQAMAVVQQQQRRISQRRREARASQYSSPANEDVSENNNSSGSQHEDCVPRAQHTAELAACEAKSSLAAEQRVQQQMQLFQEKKERELRNAMVNVRKGIQKLEASLAHEQSERKRVESELHSERQAFVQLRAELEELRDSKRVVAQRLEEANGLVGKLRDVVKIAEARASGSEEKANEAQRRQREAEARVAALETELQAVSAKLQEAVETRRQTDGELATMRAKEQELSENCGRMRLKIDELMHQLDAQRIEASNQASEELNRVSTEWQQRVLELEARVASQQRETLEIESRASSGATSIAALTAERDALQQALERAKQDTVKHKKDFHDLARMHKNLTEATTVKRHEVDARLVEMATRTASLEKQLEASRRRYHETLSMLKTQVHRLKSELAGELRQRAVKEIKAAWKLSRRATVAAGEELRAWHIGVMQREAQRVQEATDVEREDWRTRVSAKELEMAALLAGQKVDEQSKYDQLVSRLEARTSQLRAREAEAVAQEKRVNELQRTVQRLEQEREARLLEQSQLAEQLSSSRVASDRESEAKQQLQVTAATAADVAQVLWAFVDRLLKALALDPRKVLTEDDDKAPATWQPARLASDLRRVTELVHERIAAREREAATAVVRPVDNELQHAKEALAALQFADRGDDHDDSVARHLPWYVMVVRSVRRQMEQLRSEAETLRQSLTGQATVLAETKAEVERLQQLHAALVFERDTVAHEMHVQAQTLTKRRDAELLQQKDEFERKIEQLQRRQSADQAKAKEEHEIERRQLQDALDAEKKHHSKLKQDSLVVKVEHEKLQSDLHDRIIKLEKELEAATDELAKWKRKAKLAATKSPANTPSRRASVMFASSFHTDEDGSDHSYPSMFPPSRRPSSAMADLSQLMEQSLQDLRKDNEGLSPQATPPRLALQSPMLRRTSARPSPLRIPVHPSPARKRPSLVPPPRLINTAATSQSPAT